MRAEKPGSDGGLDQATSAFLAFAHACSASPTGCSGARPRPRTSCRRSGCAGRRPTAASWSNPPAFLATTTTRLAINVAQSARARRETYVGPWLPEPVDTSADPRWAPSGARRWSSRSCCCWRSSLPPNGPRTCCVRRSTTRTREIAEILQLSDANARQLVSRARKHLADERREPVDRPSTAGCWRCSSTPRRRATSAGLEDLFAADVVSYSDGNGMRGAARFPVAGHTAWRSSSSAFAPRLLAGRRSLEWVEANGRPAFWSPATVRRCRAAHHRGAGRRASITSCGC